MFRFENKRTRSRYQADLR